MFKKSLDGPIALPLFFLEARNTGWLTLLLCKEDSLCDNEQGHLTMIELVIDDNFSRCNVESRSFGKDLTSSN